MRSPNRSPIPNEIARLDIRRHDRLGGMIHEYHPPPDLRGRFSAGAAPHPRPEASTAQHPGRDLLEFCRDRQEDVTRFCSDTRIWPTNNISERGVRPVKTQQKISGLAHQRGHHPGPAGYPQLHRHRPQARVQRHGHPANCHERRAMEPASPGVRLTTMSASHPARTG